MLSKLKCAVEEAELGDAAAHGVVMGLSFLGQVRFFLGLVCDAHKSALLTVPFLSPRHGPIHATHLYTHTCTHGHIQVMYFGSGAGWDDALLAELVALALALLPRSSEDEVSVSVQVRARNLMSGSWCCDSTDTFNVPCMFMCVCVCVCVCFVFAPGRGSSSAFRCGWCPA